MVRKLLYGTVLLLPYVAYAMEEQNIEPNSELLIPEVSIPSDEHNSEDLYDDQEPLKLTNEVLLDIVAREVATMKMHVEGVHCYQAGNCKLLQAHDEQLNELEKVSYKFDEFKKVFYELSIRLAVVEEEVKQLRQSRSPRKNNLKKIKTTPQSPHATEENHAKRVNQAPLSPKTPRTPRKKDVKKEAQKRLEGSPRVETKGK